jgi:hypothetical protein
MSDGWKIFTRKTPPSDGMMEGVEGGRKLLINAMTKQGSNTNYRVT